jgi:sugar/nucleoside kinase (ribokinase family)
MSKYNVYGIGNALVDMEYKVTDEFLKSNGVDKGHMTLVDEAKQAELLTALHQEMAKKQCGGSAANTMIAISQFGGQSFYSCKVASDELGHFYLQDLKSNGVETKLTESTAPAGTTGKCMVFVTDDAERTMNTYLGITETLSDEQIDEEALKNSEWLYIEGYLVTSPTGLAAALKAKEIAKTHGVKIALTFSDPGMVQYFGKNMAALMEGGVDLLFCNEEEAKEFAGSGDLAVVREKLKEVAKTFVITLGKNGSMIWDGTMFVDIEPHVVDAIDTNGAGDMVAGAYLYGITNGHTPAGAGTIASLAASKIVSQFGPRLSTDEAQAVLTQLFGDK